MVLLAGQEPAVYSISSMAISPLKPAPVIPTIDTYKHDIEN